MAWATCATSASAACSRRRNAWSGEPLPPGSSWVGGAPTCCRGWPSSAFLAPPMQPRRGCQQCRTALPPLPTSTRRPLAAGVAEPLVPLLRHPGAGRALPTPPPSPRTTGSTSLCCTRTVWRTRRWAGGALFWVSRLRSSCHPGLRGLTTPALWSGAGCCCGTGPLAGARRASAGAWFSCPLRCVHCMLQNASNCLALSWSTSSYNRPSSAVVCFPPFPPQNAKNCLREGALAKFLDLVVW